MCNEEIILKVTRLGKGIKIESNGIKAYELSSVIKSLQDELDSTEKKMVDGNKEMFELLDGLFEAMSGNTEKLQELVDKYEK